MRIIGQKKIEIILYMVLWAVLFAAPVLSLFVSTVSSGSMSMDWDAVISAWQMLGMFFIVFLVHNFFLAPLLVYKSKKAVYFSLLFVLVICFQIYQCNFRPHDEPNHNMAFTESPMQRPMPNGEERRPPMMAQGDSQNRPAPQGDNQNQLAPQGDSQNRPAPNRPQGNHPPKAFGGQDMVAFIIMTLLMMLNVGIKYFFKTLDDGKRMRELEKQNLILQLEYLKYQINPHFFMNTLNNIHALVDINPEMAKSNIEAFSKLMRYVLYESDKPVASLSKELMFLRNYIDLMKIRYSEKVRITTDFPDVVTDKNVPTLIFIIFVENAFKHGVSYEQLSYIDVSLKTEGDNALFVCRNSIKPSDAETLKGGIGLANARKRLDLIYGNKYKLKTNSSECMYEVDLTLPLLTDKNI